jgi:hypothetical protein
MHRECVKAKSLGITGEGRSQVLVGMTRRRPERNGIMGSSSSGTDE